MSLLLRSDFDDLANSALVGRMVPTTFFDWKFFDRQRALFSHVSNTFEDDFKAFDTELERMRNDMLKFDQEPTLTVQHPFIENADGAKKLSLTFDCKDYKPEDINVRSVDNTLIVHAKHVEDTEGRSVRREFKKIYTLPQNVDPMKLKSMLSKDGVLTIEAPAPKEVEAKRERIVPIERLTDNVIHMS